jgi:L,D-peptidoglycan transpeptidase YkuD (ErfK/YbiS/YcfS/YnhG family)
MEELNSSMNIIKSFIIIIYFTVVLVLLSLTACLFVPEASKFNMKTFLAAHDNKAGKSTQIILVIDNNSLFFNERKVYTLEKKGADWKTAFEPFSAVIGKNGFAPVGEKREGDGKTPSGLFALRMTFGYDEAVITKMPYRQALVDDIWVDDPNADDYNRWVKKDATLAKSYERMKRDDNLYKYGIVIEYNTTPVIKGNGSAIFFHVWGGEDITTEGCVAVSEQDIVKILAWLDPQASPIIIMGLEN